MGEVEMCGLFILIFDTVLGLAYRAGLVLLGCSRCGLWTLWALGAVKWVALHVFTCQLTHGHPQPVLLRLAALLSLLRPVFESGRILLVPPSETYTAPSPDLNMLVLVPVASALACVVWEKLLCGAGNKKPGDTNLDTKRLLLRVLKYFKPDTFYLIAAFGFLILGVVCKCLNILLCLSNYLDFHIHFLQLLYMQFI